MVGRCVSGLGFLGTGLRREGRRKSEARGGSGRGRVTYCCRRGPDHAMIKRRDLNTETPRETVAWTV